ncbi:MT-A70 family methyltransferase [Prochlorothrix hollandica]|uniref:MT-A70 family methyltransferase n=1 Tax=Prochlorothrix hollandica TaxID=1223 RepID=UPI0003490CC3|nr:MT-A70 family methyltransferase [Prochlorothrix hollandica]
MYELIYADPPWSYRDKNKNGNRGAECKYPTMTLDDLKALPIASIAAENSILAMWWVPPQPQEALDLVAAWDFKLINMNGFTWHKQTALGKSFFGLGHWTRGNAECCLLAKRGKPQRACASVPQFLSAQIGRHSQKPAEVRDRLVQLAGDVPRIELFAREGAIGWDHWGNELPQTSVNLATLSQPPAQKLRQLTILEVA